MFDTLTYLPKVYSLGLAPGKFYILKSPLIPRPLILLSVLCGVLPSPGILRQSPNKFCFNSSPLISHWLFRLSLHTKLSVSFPCLILFMGSSHGINPELSSDRGPWMTLPLHVYEEMGMHCLDRLQGQTCRPAVGSASSQQRASSYQLLEALPQLHRDSWPEDVSFPEQSYLVAKTSGGIKSVHLG